MYSRIIGLVFILALVIAVFHPGKGWAADEPLTLTVLGSAVIQNKNTADGKRDAVNDALAAAVIRCVMDDLSPEMVARRFQVINTTILNQSQRYIQDFRVVGETVSGATVRVLIQAKIATALLKRDVSGLGLTASAVGYPRILLIFTESYPDTDHPPSRNDPLLNGDRSDNKKKLADFFQAAGYDVIPGPLAFPQTDADQPALARQMGAEVLITGTGVINRIQGHKTEGAEAEVTLRALNVETGRVMGTIRKQAVAFSQKARPAGPEALSNAGRAAAEALSPIILTAWREDQAPNTRIEVVVNGTSGQIAHFVRLRTTLSSLPGVKDLRIQEMSGDQAILMVTYEEGAASLANALRMKTFNGFSIAIMNVTDRSMRVELVGNRRRASHAP